MCESSHHKVVKALIIKFLIMRSIDIIIMRSIDIIIMRSIDII